MDEEQGFVGEGGRLPEEMASADDMKKWGYSQRMQDRKLKETKEIKSMRLKNEELSSALDKYKKRLKEQEFFINEFQSERKGDKAKIEELQESIVLLRQANNEERKKLKEKQEKYTDDARRELEVKVTTYVSNAADKLETKEESLSQWSLGWGISGALFLLAGIVSLVWYTEDITTIVNSTAKLTWPPLIYIAFRGLIITSLLLALSRYSFVFSKRFSDDAKEHEYRINAINFGRLYLEAKGADAEWDAMKDAFQNWGVSSERAQTENLSERPNPQAEKNATS